MEDNYLADQASRGETLPDWQLDRRVVQRIFSRLVLQYMYCSSSMYRWGTADVDLMATESSRQVPCYYSWSRRDSSALGLDALALDLDWSIWSLPYVFPPYSLVGAVLRKAKECQVRRLILVVPWHTGKLWFPLLLEMLLEVRKLRRNKSLLTDLSTGIAPPGAVDYRWVACLITGSTDRVGRSSVTQPGSSSRRAGGQVRGVLEQVVVLVWTDRSTLLCPVCSQCGELFK